MSSLKQVGTLDGGTATTVGGSDWDTLVSYFKGSANVFSAIINSNTEFKDGKLWLRNPSDSASIKLRAGTVTSTVEYQFPAQNSNDQILLANAQQTITGKTIDFAQNTIIGAGVGGGGGGTSTGESRKWGLIQGPRNAIDGTVSQGVLAGHINIGTPINDNDPPPAGLHWQYDTTNTSSNLNAGIRWTTTWIRRDFNAHLRVKFRTPVATSGHQLLIGLSVDNDIDATQAPLLDTQSGILVGYRSTDSNFMVIRNGGTNGQTFTPIYDDTASANPTIGGTVSKSASAIRIVDIDFTNSGNTCTVTIQQVASTAPYAVSTLFQKQYTTNLPAITSPTTGGSIYMRPVMQVTNKESVNHSLELFQVQLEEDF